jgi:hypothetical protein
MRSFLSRHQPEVKGVLSGFDRLRFRGTLLLVANLEGLACWLRYRKVLLKSFRDYAMGVTDTIKRTTQHLAEQAGRPLQYLASSTLRKEDLAREIAQQGGITQGLVCVLTCVEPCKTFTVGPNQQSKKLELRSFLGKCLHQYFYLIDPQLGWLNIRLQTWFPFTVHIVINGREWLSRDLQKHDIGYEQRENCFVDLADVERAQQLMDQQLQTPWRDLLNRLLAGVHPSHPRLFGDEPLHYYWSADETEWATDVMFRSRESLARLYPRLVHHMITHSGGNDVLRFFGRRPSVKHYHAADLKTSLATRPEGTRIKHVLDRNSIKMYDKQELVLRVETTVNNPRQMKSYRPSEDDPQGPASWRGLRKGVADLYRRAQISQQSNERYLEALAAVDTDATLAEVTADVCRRTTLPGRSVRALNPLADEDAALLQAIIRGEFVLHGFRNRDLRAQLFGDSSDFTPQQQMTKTSRLLRLLRAHGLVRKISHTHRYVVTPKGQTTATALLAARTANTRKLTELAA